MKHLSTVILALVAFTLVLEGKEPEPQKRLNDSILEIAKCREAIIEYQASLDEIDVILYATLLEVLVDAEHTLRLISLINSHAQTVADNAIKDRTHLIRSCKFAAGIIEITVAVRKDAVKEMREVEDKAEAIALAQKMSDLLAESRECLIEFN